MKTAYKKPLLFAICYLLFAARARAQASFTLPSISGVEATSPDTLVHLLFLYAITLAGLAGFAAFVYGGIMYLTASGNPARAEEAKDRLIHALLGFLVVVFSGILLRFINPDLFLFGPLSEVSIRGPSLVERLGPGAGYLSCRPQGEEGLTFCTHVTNGTTCGEDEQCAPCISRAVGDACERVRSGAPDLELLSLSCTPDIPCLTEQGGECPANFPCSEIAGGFKNNWEIVPDGRCLDPERSVTCTDEALFADDPDHYTCCLLRSALGEGTPSPDEEFSVECYAAPNPAPTNPEEGVRFGIRALGGTGNYECTWSGAIEAVGCNPEHVFALSGSYTVSVDVLDLGRSRRASNSCSVQVSPPQLTIANTRPGADQAGAAIVRFCPDDPWRATILPAAQNEDVFLKIWRDGALMQDWASIESTVPSLAIGLSKALTPFNSYTSNPLPLTTDGTGSWTLEGRFKPYLIASWQAQARVRGVETNVVKFDIKPCMRITNRRTGEIQHTIVENTNYPPFCVEDPWMLEIMGSTSTPAKTGEIGKIYVRRDFNGSALNSYLGVEPPYTDPDTGHWSSTGNFNRCLIGDWVEQTRIQDDVPGIDRFSDELHFSIESCLDVSCTEKSFTCGRDIDFMYTLKGSVDGDEDFASPPQTNPNPSHACYWTGPSPAFPQESFSSPTSALCTETNTIHSSDVAPGEHTVTFFARTEVADCTAQGLPQPENPQPYFDAECSLNISAFCDSDSDCDDENECTEDNCINPSTCDSYCENPVIAGTHEEESGCSGGSISCDPVANTEDACTDDSSCGDSCNDGPTCGDPLLC